MATITEVHDYFNQPAYVLRSMRFEQWRAAKLAMEGELSIHQALEVRRSLLPDVDQQAEIRRNLGFGLA